MKSIVTKIIADKKKYHFETQKVENEISEDSYIKMSSPFFSYAYEQIEKIREKQNVKVA